jgi:O-methyltransferase
MISNYFRFKLLVKLGSLLYPKYSFRWPQLNWLEDRSFNTYLAKFGEDRGHNKERRWMIQQLMRLIDAVPGDTAECGVFEGAGSYLICRANAASSSFKRWHHIFDSFEGLSPPAAADGDYWHQGDLSRGEEIVRQNLAEFTAFQLYKGWIPERFADVADKCFSFVHIDVDLYQPTLDSLRFFYERMNPGGIILCDDYGFLTCPGATQAVSEYLSGKSEAMVALPDGGGFLIKGLPTSRHGDLQIQ